MEPGILSDVPAVKITDAVSPTHLPMANTIPVIIPGSAQGSTTLVTHCHFVPPVANATSRYDWGTALIASSLDLIMKGSIIRLTVSDPESIDQLKFKSLTKNINPNSPSTIEGTPARQSIPNRIALVAQPSVVYSVR